MSYERFKRIADLVTSGLAIVVLAPLFVVVWIIIRISMGAPAIFKQERPGLNEKIFVLYKFRTMKEVKRSDGSQEKDEKRLTRMRKY